MNHPHDDSFFAVVGKVLAWPFVYASAWWATWTLPQIEGVVRIVTGIVGMACMVLHAWLAWRKRNKP